MRYSDHLYSLANQFRREFLESDDERDDTLLPSDWRDESVELKAKGGNYVCGHLRRQDFLYGRASDVPSLEFAAKQLEKIALLLDVQNIFVASDGTNQGTVPCHIFLVERCEFHSGFSVRNGKITQLLVPQVSIGSLFAQF